MPDDALTTAVKRVASGLTLGARETTEAFGIIMRGEATPVQIAALLVGLRVRGETAGEVAGAARALRDAMVPLVIDQPSGLVDTCGTGGGVLQTFNISTAAALLAAGAGVRVAKHGNRSFTSRSGSADVLEALGVAIDVPVERMAQAIRDAGIVFMYAPAMHPAMRFVGPVRRELSIPTIMNLLGPLANPASAGRQVVGVADPSRLALIADALSALGAVHALVVHGDPGMDEISPLGPTRVFEIREGRRSEWTIDPTDYGIDGHAAGDLAGALPADNARTIVDVLAGRGRPGAVEAVVLNAAGAIYVGGLATTFRDGVAVARAALQNGAGMAALDRLRRALPGAAQ
ncbi:MAG: anthranilate phosphoribosyltransferase [Gemmatimonadaceae bacterium]